MRLHRILLLCLLASLLPSAVAFAQPDGAADEEEDWDEDEDWDSDDEWEDGDEDSEEDDADAEGAADEAAPEEGATDEDASEEDADASEEEDADASEEDADADAEDADEDGDDWDDDESWDDEEEGDPEETPSDSDTMLDSVGPDSSDPTRRRYTAPLPVVSLHGYLRVRGELFDNLSLGRGPDSDDLPFSLWRPQEAGATAEGGHSSCTTGETACFRGADRLRMASMRLRLSPTISLSDYVRVHMTFDILDNVVMGSTPDTVIFVPTDGVNSYPNLPIGSFTATQVSPSVGINSAQDAIFVRRAWAEVINRDIGVLRFGRMPYHWGLGMVFNAGNGIDDDQSTEVDRVMAMANIGDIMIGAAYDFAGEGIIRYPGTPVFGGRPLDATQRDDLRQFTIMAAHRPEEDEIEERVAAGDVVVYGGLQFQYRRQGWDVTSEEFSDSLRGDTTIDTLIRRRHKSFLFDAYGVLRWDNLRIGAEAAINFGSVGDADRDPGTTSPQSMDILQFGVALESEYRALNEQLGVYFNTGFATGDRDVDGLSIYENTISPSTVSDDRISHFGFHPNYRVDLILFRNVLGAIGGAWYLKPGISYDILRNDAGQRFGIRADMIYSRASRQVQAYGGDPNLGVELDGTVYYRSEDGPEIWDGYYLLGQYGVLFPLEGLDDRTDTDLSAGRAQVLRLLLGVQF